MRVLQCLHCARAFLYRPDKRFCSYVCQVTAEATYDPERCCEPCYYCGLPGDTVDHIPPQSVRPRLIDQKIRTWRFIEVTACAECNSLLGASKPWTLAARKRVIKRKLSRRYSHYLRIPEWTPAELAQHDPHSLLGSYIHSGVQVKQAAQARIRW